ncbi:hypothetical protein O181_099091 [Austropuccinia psidii MF-1]|uniref:Uncharacterized protein n=1 Tax=Austropuccinia psidii MF-1 TaxID=1389203 RepID=A0A9Q3JC66_9BASI|nr:hypothetical protein [Austropuccinia psidii MF-1]
MWKKACYTSAKCIAEAKEYIKQRYDKTHMEPDFKEGDKVLVSTLNFNNLKGEKVMRDSFLGRLTMMKLIGKNAVEVRLRGIPQEAPSIPSESGKTILLDRTGQVPLQKEDYHSTRHSGSRGLP